jgi:hypothetical protein
VLRTIELSVLAFASVACGDGAIEPDPTPEALPLDGIWQYTADLDYPNGMVCQIRYTVTLEQRRRTDTVTDVFVGFAEDGRFACEAQSTPLTTSAINRGLFMPSTSRLSFDVSTDLHHFGELSAGAITGQVEHDNTLHWGEGQGTFRMTRP